MTAPMVENELRPVSPQDTTVAAQVQPQDVERFREALEQNESHNPGRGNKDESAADNTAPAWDGASTWEGLSAHRFVAPVPVLSPAPARSKPMQTVSAVRRTRLQTHAARNGAMQPLADLLFRVHQRAAGRVVLDMKIVPPQPNPLRLTLRLSMDDGAFVVKVHTGLEADHRDEVKQALQVLQSSLAARLTIPARVVLLA